MKNLIFSYKSIPDWTWSMNDVWKMWNFPAVNHVHKHDIWEMEIFKITYQDFWRNLFCFFPEAVEYEWTFFKHNMFYLVVSNIYKVKKFNKSILSLEVGMTYEKWKFLRSHVKESFLFFSRSSGIWMNIF